MASGWETITHCPLTLVTCIVCVLWWFYTWNYRFDLGRVSVSYKQLVEDKQYWRVVTASYSHANIMHIAFNVLSLWNLNFIEIYYGSVYYAKATFILIIFSELLGVGIKWILIHKFNRQEQREQGAVGYSCVVFGLMSLVSAIEPLQKTSFMGLFSVWNILYPFCSLIFTQIIVPQASFLGHFSGIIIGFLIGFKAFIWVHDYLFYCLLVWAIIGLLINLKNHSPFPMNFCQIGPQFNSGAPRSTIRDGNIVPLRDEESLENEDEAPGYSMDDRKL